MKVIRSRSKFRLQEQKVQNYYSRNVIFCRPQLRFYERYTLQEIRRCLDVRATSRERSIYRRRFGTSWSFPFVDSQRCLINVTRATSSCRGIDVAVRRRYQTSCRCRGHIRPVATSIRRRILTSIWRLIATSYYGRLD